VTEREIQKEFVKGLRDLEFKVYVTSNRRPTANTEGLPDVLVLVGDCLYIGCEVKSPKGKVGKKQTNSIIVRDPKQGVLDVMATIKKFFEA
jgi:hypothetical protein